MKDYISVKEAVSILGTTRQNIFYLKNHGIIKDFIRVHKTCVLYNRAELLKLAKEKKQNGQLSTNKSK